MNPKKPKQGGPENKMTLTLSTGYQVDLDLMDARAGLEHLARALMGEVMYPKLKRALKIAQKRKTRAAEIAGLQAVKGEILKIVNKLDHEDLRLLVMAVMFAYLGGEFDRINRTEAAAN